MIDAMKLAESFGAKVSYNAPLLMPGKIMEKYSTVPVGDLLRKYLLAQLSSH